MSAPIICKCPVRFMEYPGGLRVDRHAVHVSVITCEMAVRALRERRGLEGIQLCCLDKWRRERDRESQVTARKLVGMTGG